MLALEIALEELKEEKELEIISFANGVGKTEHGEVHVDNTGKARYNWTADRVMPFREGKAWVMKGESWILVDEKGRVLKVLKDRKERLLYLIRKKQ